MYLLIITAVLTVIWWVLYKRKTPLDFPGPRGWPLLGNLPQIDNSTFHLKLTEWSKTYGGCYKINLLGQEKLVISDPALIHECQVTRGAEFAGRSKHYEVWDASGRGADIVLSNPTPLWKRMRKIVHTSIRQYDTGMERIQEITMNAVDDMMQYLKQMTGENIDIEERLHLLTVNIIASLLVGKTYTAQSEFFKQFRTLEHCNVDLAQRRMAGAIMDVIPALDRFYNLLSGPIGRFLKANDAMFNLIKQEVDISDPHNQSLMFTLLTADDADRLPDVNLKFLITDVVIAGTLTTTNTLHQFINIMAHHQEVQEKLQEETDSVLGERRVTLKDREHMPYHLSVLFETLRYTSLAPLGFPHMALKDTQILGRPVLAGTTIFFNHFALNHNEALFPDPYIFRPERFLDENGSLVPADHPNRSNMNAFGSGPRVCLGQSLAKGRLFLVMASLLQSFRIIPGDEAVSCDPRHLILKALLVSPKYKVMFMERNTK